LEWRTRTRNLNAAIIISSGNGERRKRKKHSPKRLTDGGNANLRPCFLSKHETFRRTKIIEFAPFLNWKSRVRQTSRRQRSYPIALEMRAKNLKTLKKPRTILVSACSHYRDAGFRVRRCLFNLNFAYTVFTFTRGSVFQIRKRDARNAE